jgi:hypothetical protein
MNNKDALNERLKPGKHEPEGGMHERVKPFVAAEGI